jgi:hypothetical protein
MWEMAAILMRAAPGWMERQASGSNLVFQFKDAIMTIFPNGNWRCVAPQTRLVQGVAQGKVSQLEKFLQGWAAANPL